MLSFSTAIKSACKCISVKFSLFPWKLLLKYVLYVVYCPISCVWFPQSFYLQVDSGQCQKISLLTSTLFSFPPSLVGSGGIMFWADTVGSNHIYTSLKRWSQMYGNFFKPSRYLEERATKGMPLVKS